MIKPLTDAQKVKLQRLIDRAADAATKQHKAVTALNDACEKIYGYAPSDIDCDSAIDAILGGCGNAPGMSAEEFEKEMASSMAMAFPGHG